MTPTTASCSCPVKHHTRELGQGGANTTRVMWWQAIVDARKDAGGALGVNAIAVAAQSDGVIVVDDEGRILRPALVGADEHLQIDADWLVRDFGGPQMWAAACGVVPDATHAVAKLASLHHHEPELFGQIGKVLLPHDYLTYRMVKRFVTDRGDASATGYWSPRENRWRADVLRVVDEQVDWGRCLPEVLGPIEPAGDREGVIVAPGTGSQPAAALGIGMRPRDVVVALDRSGTCFALRERLTEDSTGRVADRADATGRFLPTTRTIRRGDVLETMAAQVGIDVGHIDQLALQAPAGAGGVRYVPYREADDADRTSRAERAISRACTRASPRSTWRARWSRVWCAAFWKRSTRSRTRVCPSTGACGWSGRRRGRTRSSASWPTSPRAR